VIDSQQVCVQPFDDLKVLADLFFGGQGDPVCVRRKRTVSETFYKKSTASASEQATIYTNLLVEESDFRHE